MYKQEAIEHPKCPQWLKDADWVGDVEISNWGYVTWKDGVWEGGTWKHGDWEGGIWKNGTWEDGTWEDGTWMSGIWMDGTWEDGTWKDGTWESGTWKDGWKNIGHCKWPVRYSDKAIQIGCETKTTKEWENWFASDEEFETKRGTEQFEKIYKSFLMAKAAQEIEFGLEEK